MGEASEASRQAGLPPTVMDIAGDWRARVPVSLITALPSGEGTTAGPQ